MPQKRCDLAICLYFMHAIAVSPPKKMTIKINGNTQLFLFAVPATTVSLNLSITRLSICTNSCSIFSSFTFIVWWSVSNAVLTPARAECASGMCK